MEAEHGDIAIGAAADRPAPIGRADGVGGILDHPDAVARGQRRDLRHVAGLAGEVHRHHNLRQAAGPLGLDQTRLERGHAHAAARRVDVDEVHRRAEVERAVGRGHEAVGRGPETVAGAQPQRLAGAMQGRGGAGEGDGVSRLATGRHRRLEARHRRPLGQEVRAQHLDHRGDVGLVDLLAAIGNHSPALRFTARISWGERKCGLVPEWY